MNELWKISPYLGVFPLVLSARNKAFSAPKIWTVEDGNFARFVKEPAWEIKRAATRSPMRVLRLGDTTSNFLSKYCVKVSRISQSFNTSVDQVSMLVQSMAAMSCPMDMLSAL